MTRVRSLICLTLLALASVPAAAQGRDSTTIAPAPWVTRTDLAIIGLGAGLAYLAQQHDLDARATVRSAGNQANGTLRALAETGNAWGGSVALVTGLGMWAGGVHTGHSTVAAIGFRGVEAITVSGLITKTLKAGFGRARPRVNGTDPWDVEFGRGWDNDHESFPSGHSTAAFAFAAAVTSETMRRAPERARLVGASTFALAGVTAYARMHADAHWLSDVTMGAAIGMASGWAVTRWHATRPGNRIDAVLLPGVSPLVLQGPQGRTVLGASITWR